VTERPRTRVVVDASAVVALLSDGGGIGDWVESVIAETRLFAPELMPFEAANILRRHSLAGIIDASSATLAHADLVDLPVDLVSHRVLADRVWELRSNVTVYDASYVALAERVSAPLVTLDGRLARAPGIACAVLVYPGT
jgi:predicted nucleic acid-binding protein